MEVFFHGLKPGCSEKRLKIYLTKVFSEFNISIQEFMCEKKTSSKIASATILDPKKGELFLKQYADRRGALNLDGPFACHMSRHVVDQLKLRSLEKKLKDSQRKAPRPKQSPEIKGYWASSIACGNWTRKDGHLQFVSLYSAVCPTQVHFGKKEMILLQPMQDGSKGARWIVIGYSSIQSLATCSEQKDRLLFTLDRAPKFYDPAQPAQVQSTSLNDLFAGLSVQSRRVEEPKKIRTSAIDIWHAKFVESCMVYQIVLLPGHLQLVKRLLRKDKHLPHVINWHFSVRSSSDPFYSAMLSLHQTLTDSGLSFAVNFQLQRLAQNSYLVPEMVERLVSIMKRVQGNIGIERSVQYLQQLARHLPFAGPDADGRLFEFNHLKDYLEHPEEEVEDDELSAFHIVRRNPQLVLVHRARVTPCGIYLHGPYAEATNGVLERYKQYALEHFLRVSFEDENGEALKYEPSASLHYIHHKRFKGVLDNGIQIAGRNFQFLGFSHSSLRESSCWFLAPFIYDDSLMFSKRLITLLGDFSNIRSPAKCGARIGQAFTDLNDNIFVPRSAVVSIKDVERNGRCFSDGCSTGSLELFERLWAKMRPNTFKPTTFQIRYGGVKGVISLDRSLEGLVMQVRKSQKKFISTTELLGICGAARRTLPLYLNRPMIKILEDLGIETEAFMVFQDTAVQQLRTMTSSAINAAAFAENYDLGTAAGLPSLLRELCYLGINALEDHFLWSAIELIVILRLREIKYKGRIPIHTEGGATLYGIMDETNTLKSGEIYCTVDEGRVIIGPVAVTRSPAMHPGDVQPAIAVNLPKNHPLKDLHNVVVFSQQGERDLPSMLSGGDLDGDLFNVIIDPTLQPAHYYPAAEYARPDPIDLGRIVEAQDISNFFIEFMANDQLGHIAIKHLQLADHAVAGTLDPDCITLSEMHSTAVDFSKTGIPVDMTMLPRMNAKCKPDYMASGPRMLLKGGAATLETNPDLGFYQEDEDDVMHDLEDYTPNITFYESTKALGHLYRSIDEKKFLDDVQKGKRSGSADSQCALSKLWSHVQRETQGFVWEHLKPWATNIRDQYYNQVADMMYQFALDPHRPLTELEVFLGIVMGKDGGIPSKRAREAASSLRERFNDVVIYTVECMLKGENGRFDEEALERSLACFAVSLVDEAEEDTELDMKIGKLQSFGYLAGPICLRQVQRELESMASRDLAEL